ncbi:dUTP diphosphatase [Halobacillus sp. BBL2006]|uniref:dUTP diphosphatase n=1 Tax=Halobacillus sp. BBL2006 TaxID=1543706 RepID=UPI000542DCED|nr:dUTP diphosphatase [Halobacillus sp. BBL2006]KHE73172.1 hypothetical protein LD39_00875 [Halobacillus sp. BBL2006]
MTNWKKVWDAQKTFDERVISELNVKPTIANRCAAFRIEIGELANELPEIFKWWSHKKNNLEKALVEYVDGLKFLVGFGIELGVKSIDLSVMDIKTETVAELHSDCDWLSQLIERELSLRGMDKLFIELFSTYLKLGHEIGFTGDQIMQAFEDKHEVINERLDVGY